MDDVGEELDDLDDLDLRFLATLLGETLDPVPQVVEAEPAAGHILVCISIRDVTRHIPVPSLGSEVFSDLNCLKAHFDLNLYRGLFWL